MARAPQSDTDSAVQTEGEEPALVHVNHTTMLSISLASFRCRMAPKDSREASSRDVYSGKESDDSDVNI